MNYPTDFGGVGSLRLNKLGSLGDVKSKIGTHTNCDGNEKFFRNQFMCSELVCQRKQVCLEF